MSASFSDSLAAEINSVSRTEVRLKKHLDIDHVNLPLNTLFQLRSASLFAVDGGGPQTGRDQLPAPGLYRQNHRGHHGVQPLHPGGQIDSSQPHTKKK